MECNIAPGSKILITGATGYTGTVLVKKLLKENLEIRALARQSSNLEAFEGEPVKWIRGDVFDEETMRKAMKDIDYVFHIAAAFREAKSTEKDYWNVHVKSTQLIVEEALKNPEFKRLIHVSTAGVHGHIENPPGNEQSPFSPGDGYQRTKAQAENWLEDFATKNSSFPFTIIRPCAIYGPGEKRLLKLFKMATNKYFPILGYGKCWYHLVHVEDLTNAMILSATSEEALGESFIIGGKEAIKLEEMVSIIAKEYNHKLKIIRMPITPFFILGDLCELICKPFRIEPPIYRRRVAFYSKDRNFSTEKMQKKLGYKPIYDNKAGIIESAKWYLEKNWLKI